MTDAVGMAFGSELFGKQPKQRIVCRSGYALDVGVVPKQRSGRRLRTDVQIPAIGVGRLLLSYQFAAGPQSMNRGLNEENGRTVCSPCPSVRTIRSAFWS